MTDDLDRRAAEAMGWEPHLDARPPYFKMSNGEARTLEATSFRGFMPTTDANACRELLQEVERRGLGLEFDKVFGGERAKTEKDWRMGYLGPLLSPLPLIVQAAVEVLERSET